MDAATAQGATYKIGASYDVGDLFAAGDAFAVTGNLYESDIHDMRNEDEGAVVGSRP